MLNRVLLYNSGGGLGDSLQILPIIETLKSEFKSADFYYLSAHENHFNNSLKDFNIKIKTLDVGVKYFGFRWWHIFSVIKKFKKNNTKPFDLIIDFQSKIRNSLILKLIPHKYFISSCFNFSLSKPSINIKKDKKINKTLINAINLMFKKESRLIDFNLNTINNKFFEEAKRLLPEKNYVGFSITQGNVYRKKEWPIEKIVKTAEALNENNKIPVFFIEKKDKLLKGKIENLIPFAKFPEHETDLSSPALVSCLAKRLDFAISIDNGVMHMMSLAKIPMIVLFGPTDSEKFAPENKSIIVLDSKKIYKSKNISLISVEDVLQAAKQHSNFLY